MRNLCLLTALLNVAVFAGEVLPPESPKPAATKSEPEKTPPASSADKLATIEADKDEPRTVPLPNPKSVDTVIKSLDLGLDITEPEMKFNDVLLLLGRVEDIVVIVMPELSSPEVIGKKIVFTTGRLALRDFLNQVCAQIGAEWKLDENQAIVLSESKKITLLAGVEPKKIKLDLDYAGEPLTTVVANLARQTGLVITCDPDVGAQKIEVILQGWEIERVLRYLANMYGLQLQPNAAGYHLSKAEE